VMISGTELGSVVSTYLHQTPKAPANAVGGSVQPGSPAADGVVLSAQSGSVSRLVSALQSVPDIRSERVLEARNRVQSGQPPSSSDVARQILSRVVGDRLAAGS